MPDNDKMLAYADTVWNSFATRFDRINQVYGMSRLRVGMPSSVQGRDVKNAPLAEAYSLLSQLLAFVVSPRAQVLPKDNTQKEDEQTTRIEQWFAGYPSALAYTHMHPFMRFMHNYGETGIGALLLDFDEAQALDGELPFRVTAPAPESLAFQFSNDRLVCAVIKENVQVAGLYDDLKERWDDAKENGGKVKWTIPDVLSEAYDEAPTSMIETRRMFTPKQEYFWVQGERVWEKPLLVEGVPLDLAFCNPVPSDKPEEWGLGLLYPILELLKSRQILLDKALTGFSFFTMPLVVVKYNDGTIRIEQAKPGGNYESAVEVTPLQVQPNYNSLQLLGQEYKEAIGKASIQEVLTGMGGGKSGYDTNLLQDPVRRRISKIVGEAGALDGAALGIAAHYKRVRDFLEYFANEAQAKALGARGEEAVKTYLNSFGTVAAPPDDQEKKRKARVVLSSADVIGYDDIVVDLMPEEPSDENAKYQRAQLAMQAGMSREGVFRNVLKVEHPDEELAWQREDMLMNDEMWKEFITKKAIKDKLNKDKQLAQEFLDFLQAKAQEQPPVPQPQDTTQPQPQDMMQGQPPPQDTSMMGGNGMDMQGMSPDVLPPQQMGMGQPDPQMQAMMQGGMMGGMNG